MMQTLDVLDALSLATAKSLIEWEPGAGGAASGEAVRRAIRRGAWRSTTATLATDCIQAHVVILPASLAEDFRDFCVRNPQACPLLAVSEPGQAMLPSLGDDIDIRADLPAYEMWCDGELKATPYDIVSAWRRDLVTFVIASTFTFTFEPGLLALAENPALQIRGKVAPIYRTQVPTATVGPFGGPLYVAMRPLRAGRVIQAIETGIRLGEAHGLPIHLGDPALIGIDDLGTPEQGDVNRPAADELAVFWASGLTALAAARRACPALCITNAPGALLVTDLQHGQPMPAWAPAPRHASHQGTWPQASLLSSGSPLLASFDVNRQ